MRRFAVTAGFPPRAFDVGVEPLDDKRIRVVIEGAEQVIDLHAHGAGRYSWLSGTHVVSVAVDGSIPNLKVCVAGDMVPVEVSDAALVSPSISAARGPTGPVSIRTPIPGRVVRILTTSGAQIAAGHGLVVVEAMKMENEIRAPRAGVVGDIRVREGDAVEAGQELLVLA